MELDQKNDRHKILLEYLVALENTINWIIENLKKELNNGL